MKLINELPRYQSFSRTPSQQEFVTNLIRESRIVDNLIQDLKLFKAKCLTTWKPNALPDERDVFSPHTADTYQVLDEGFTY
jgi:hypothetical protein